MDPLSLQDLAAHHRRVRGLVASLVGDPDLGEDAVQGAWLKLLEAKGRPWPHQVGAWLNVTARRVASNERRGDRRRRDRERLLAQPEPVPSSAEIAERTEASSRVLAALGALGEPHQSVLRDHYLGGLTAPQIAARDDLPLETVRSRLRRGRAAFRNRLEADGLGGDVHWSVAAAPLVLEFSPALALGTGALATATGWILMKHFAVALTLVAIAVLALRMIAASGNPESQSAGQVIDVDDDLEAVASSAEDQAEQGSSTDPPKAERFAVNVEPSGPDDTAYHLVLGRVIDGNGRPLEGALVRAVSAAEWPSAAGEMANSGKEAVGAAGAGRPANGVETKAGSDGRFSLNLPLPIPPSVTVKVTAGRHRTRHAEVLANRRKPIAVKPAKDEELGVIQLVQASAILGCVIAEDGKPIGNARLTIWSREFGSIGLDAVSSADGRYVLGHNPAGVFQVTARAHGYFERAIEGVEMRAGQDTLGVDFVLQDAPLISGKVIDQDGVPMAGLRVYAWPKAKGGHSTPTWADSDMNGDFVVSPARPVHHDLKAGRKGYEAMGAAPRGRVRALPGDENVEIVLQRMPSYALQVVDGATGEPVEKFGVSVLKNNGMLAEPRWDTERRPPAVADHPGGTAELTARVGVDAVFVVAPGYDSYDQTFGLDDGRRDTRTVRLVKSQVVKGRVLRDGAPVAGARVVLEKPHRQHLSWGSASLTARVTVFVADKHKRSETTSDLEGRFEVPMIGYGHVRVSASMGDREVCVRQVSVEGDDHDLGDMPLGRYGAIEGQVLVPLGQTAEGLKVSLGEGPSVQKVLTGANGRFRLERVLPGLQRLALRGVDPHLESMTGEAFEVAAGQTAQANLDASGYGRGELVLTILIDGKPATGTEVDVKPLRVTPFSGSQVLGECDELGRVRGYCRTYPRVAVGIFGFSNRLYHPGVFLEPRLGEVQEHTISFQMAGVTLRLPEDLAWPANARLELESFRTDRTVRLCERSIVLEAGAIRWPAASDAAIAPRTLTMPRLLAGSQILRLAVHDLDRPGTSKVVDSKLRLSLGPNDFVLEAEVTLRPGLGNEIQLRPAD